eukprot:10929336-Lingulodinium_polyedra.AAC.1
MPPGDAEMCGMCQRPILAGQMAAPRSNGDDDKTVHLTCRLAVERQAGTSAPVQEATSSGSAGWS